MEDKILLIDGHGLAYRAFHALPELNAPDGTPTNVITGFMNMLMRVQDEIAPLCSIAVFDAHGPTFRHEQLPQYKANRPPTPDEFKQQIPILQELLRAMGYPVVIEQGVEADDVIASLALKIAGSGRRAVILSSDKDIMQILGTDGISMMRPVKSGLSSAVRYDAAGFAKEFGFAPSSMPDYLALLGDSSDNVPGVAGIGKTIAGRLISQFGTIENIFASINETAAGVRKKLEAAGPDSIIAMRGLIRLKTDVPADVDACLECRPDLSAAMELVSRLALTKVARRIADMRIAGDDADAHETARAERVRVSVEEIRGGAVAVYKTGGVWCAELADGRCAELSGEAMRDFLGDLTADELITDDYKSLLSDLPGADMNGRKIWDLRTAHYLLHPDTSAKAFPSFTEDGEASLFLLRAQLDAEIDKHEGLREVMTDIDLPLIPVLDKMERHGVRLDQGKFDALRGELEVRIKDIEAEAAGLTGGAINLNSPKQISDLLFNRLGFTPESKTKGKTSFSTDSSVLERLAEMPGGELPALILEYRELSKMLSGFVVPLTSAAGESGVIHTTFMPAFTGTGRLSSRDPNLQNIPAFGEWAERIKDGLVPVHEGNIFVAADYSQIELRVLAHISGEERLIDAFYSRRDIHRETASWVFSVMPDMVTPEMRRMAKVINFGLLYGMSSFGLAERLGVTRHEADAIIKRYFSALPEVKSFLKNIVEQAKAGGAARTIYGRIRPVDEIQAFGRGALDRVLINTPIQGTAADIARRAMVSFERAFSGDESVRLFLQVHDSLVCECPRGRAEEIAEAMREIMSGAAELRVPLDVEVKTGETLNL